MHYHGVVANASDFHSSDPKYEVLYNVDLVNLLLKQWGEGVGVGLREIEGLILLFL